ncbi:MAG: hypothetical protein ACYC91_14670 [Solirubrobacteraceae bacterium]
MSSVRAVRTSLSSSRAFCHVSSFSVVEATYLGMVFILAAK